MAAILSSWPSPLLGPPHPDADAILAALAAHAEGRKGADDPFLQRHHEAAYVRSPALEVEHHIGDPLAGAVIGELPTAAGAMHGEACLNQFLRPCAGAGGVERRMLKEPHQLRCGAVGNRSCARRHRGDGVLVADEIGAHAPFHRRKIGRWIKRFH